MNTNNIKKYAPQARNQFRDAVIQKLTTLGISADKKGNLQIADAELVGETMRYGQFDYPKSTLTRRDRLVKRAREQGFDVLVEHCAYTWFNRLCAIRYMEIHGYLDHGFHMLSHPDNPTGFEVLDHVPEVAEALLPEKKAQLVEMKLSGNQDEAIYRELLLAQCHALHRAMPFLFEAVDDEAELLLPDNLTRTDSILRGLVDGIPEEDWQEVEVIGWLYQFYISEKKDAVIGKVVKSEDIPAATQLFTPNWIVQYLVQNSVGRQWLQNAFSLLKENGFNAQVNMQSWMFLSSYEALRNWLLDNKTFITMAHLGARAFGQISGEVVQTTAWVIKNQHSERYQPVFFRLIDGREEVKKSDLLLRKNIFDKFTQHDFKNIPGMPIAYWIDLPSLLSFRHHKKLGEKIALKAGMSTGDNIKFQRYWYEVSIKKTLITNKESNTKIDIHNIKWFPCSSGGEYRKWYGNNEIVVNWENNGYEIRNFKFENGKTRSAVRNDEYYFREGITWSKISQGNFCVRYRPKGFVFDDTGRCGFSNNKNELLYAAGLMCTPVVNHYLSILAPTLSFTSGELASVPYPEIEDEIIELVTNAIEIAKNDWDSQEQSWDYVCSPLLEHNSTQLLRNIYKQKINTNIKLVETLLLIENTINNIFIDKLQLDKTIIKAVLQSEITLLCNPNYRYKNIQDHTDLTNKYYTDITIDILSYIIGCMMGRYSLDREGLVYAHEGNKGFAELVAEDAYKTFPADNDGILPLMDDEWFDDDVTSRVKEFVRTVWGEEHLQENLEFIAESLCLYAIKPKKGESALDTIRRYLSTQFWKDHMKMYKKRPIYWLFSSGKEKAFECLVYLHRYNDATLARMRTEYVVPLLARYQANIDRLNEQVDGASGGEATRLKRERDSLSKKFNELRSFDDRLRHYADMRISIDLDDGVKVNYGKFGDLLADVKAITGNAPEII